MPIRPEDVPSDPARLVAMVLALDTENERLRAIVRTLKDLLFGARSERAAVIDVAQLPLDLDDLAVGPTPPPPPANDDDGTERKLKRPRRPAVRNIGALPKHLPRCEEVIDVAQLPLDLDDLAVGPTPPPPPANDDDGTERKGDRPRRPAVRNIGALPKHLPRCEEVIEPETTICPCCSGALHRIGEET